MIFMIIMLVDMLRIQNMTSRLVHMTNRLTHMTSRRECMALHDIALMINSS